MTVVNSNGYIQLWNPVPAITSKVLPPVRPFMMKSLFSDNSLVCYKPGSLSMGTANTVRNSSVKSKRT
jgi:hypothetical protein